MPLQQSLAAALMCALVFSAVPAAARSCGAPDGRDVITVPASAPAPLAEEIDESKLSQADLASIALAETTPGYGPRFAIFVRNAAGKDLPLALVPNLSPGDTLRVTPTGAGFDPSSGRGHAVVLALVKQGTTIEKSDLQARFWRSGTTLDFKVTAPDLTPVLLFVPQSVKANLSDADRAAAKALDIVAKNFGDTPEKLFSGQLVAEQRGKQGKLRQFLAGFSIPQSDAEGRITANEIAKFAVALGVPLDQTAFAKGSPAVRIAEATKALEKLEKLTFDYNTVGSASRLALQVLAKRQGYTTEAIGRFGTYIEVAIGLFNLIEALRLKFKKFYRFTPCSVDPEFSDELAGSYNLRWRDGTDLTGNNEKRAFIFSPKKWSAVKTPDLNFDFHNQVSCLARSSAAIAFRTPDVIARLDVRDFELVVSNGATEIARRKLAPLDQNVLTTDFSSDDVDKIRSAGRVTVLVRAAFGFDPLESAPKTLEVAALISLEKLGLAPEQLIGVRNDTPVELALNTPAAACLGQVAYIRNGRATGSVRVDSVSDGATLLTIDMRGVAPGDGRLCFYSLPGTRPVFDIGMHVTESIADDGLLTIVVTQGSPTVTVEGAGIRDVLKLLDAAGREYLRTQGPVASQGGFKAEYTIAGGQSEFVAGTIITLRLVNHYDRSEVPRNVEVAPEAGPTPEK